MSREILVASVLCFTICTFFLCQISGESILPTCPDDATCMPRACRGANISVPLPFDSETIPSDCFEARNLLRPNRSVEVFYNGLAVIYNQSMIFCPSAQLSTSESDHWRIELQSLHNIYAVLLWRNGPLDDVEKMKVTVIRQVSSYQKESVECKYSIQHDSYHYFYCYSDTQLTSDYRLGIEGHTVEIKGHFFIDNSRDISKSVKIYSYPVRLCASPEAYENQKLYPTREHYFVGEEVEYTCADATFKLVGNSTRICKLNGLWTGRPPICLQVERISPAQYFVSYLANSTHADEETKPYSPAMNRHQALVLVPQQTITFELEEEYCLQRVSIHYYSEPSKRSNITVTLAEGVVLPMTESLNDASRTVKYRIENDNFVCTRQINIERHGDKVNESLPVSADLILEVYAKGYQNPVYECLNFPMFTSYELAESTIWNNEKLRLQCSQGFEPDEDYPLGAEAETKCKNGAWKGHLPNCKRAFCPSPVKNDFSSWKYKVESNNQTYFNEVIYNCDDGFKLQGESTSKCINGRWTNSPPFCQGALNSYNTLTNPIQTSSPTVTHCPPISASKGRLMSVDGVRPELVSKNDDGTVLYNHGVTLQFQCSPGFDLIGDQTMTCLNEEWSSPFPICKEIVCDFAPFKVEGVESNSTPASTWSIGEHTFTCPTGYAIERRSSEKVTSILLHCQSNGRWLEESEEFECVQQPAGLTIIELALISAGVTLAVAAIVILFCRICKRRRRRNKVEPLDASDELKEPTKELNEHLVHSSHMLITTKGDHPPTSAESPVVLHECETSKSADDVSLLTNDQA